jgi:hypothetical protein
MKKAFVTLFALLTIGIAVSFARWEANVDPKILSAFQKEFSFASDARWEMEGSLARVSFSFNDQAIIAWYNADAELVTTARSILYNQLPISVTRSLDKQYADAAILAITEIHRNGETYYQVQIEKRSKRFLLKAYSSGNIIVLKRIK